MPTLLFLFINFDSYFCLQCVQFRCVIWNTWTPPRIKDTKHFLYGLQNPPSTIEWYCILNIDLFTRQDHVFHYSFIKSINRTKKYIPYRFSLVFGIVLFVARVVNAAPIYVTIRHFSHKTHAISIINGIVNKSNGKPIVKFNVNMTHSWNDVNCTIFLTWEADAFEMSHWGQKSFVQNFKTLPN